MTGKWKAVCGGALTLFLFVSHSRSEIGALVRVAYRTAAFACNISESIGDWTKGEVLLHLSAQGVEVRLGK
jgi:hypothetical protein